MQVSGRESSVCENDVRALKLDHRYYSSITDISMNS